MFVARPKLAMKTDKIDATEKEVQPDVREDEEQRAKQQEIIDLLVAAGYFRARIKGLSAFDKVVGGMTWCIDTCNFDVDIDLLFQENLTIGQKIALTEKIVAVLPQMKCPHAIEPHQIQGLDFIHIFPVVQWLVKKSVETREERGDLTRSLAISQFDKQFSLPEEQRDRARLRGVEQHVRLAQEVYRPRRLFRRRDPPPAEEERRVQSTLLEYGHSAAVLAAAASDSTGSTSDQASPERLESDKHEELQIQDLMKGMSSAPEQEGRVAASVVGSIVSLRAEEIEKAAAGYARVQAEKSAGLAGGSSALAVAQRQAQLLGDARDKLQRDNRALQDALGQRSRELQAVRARAGDARRRLAALEASETDHNQGVLRRLQRLVLMNESLRQQEQQFREQCRAELERLQALVKEAQAEAGPDREGDGAAPAGAQLQELRDKVRALRLALAKRNRAIASLQRQLDEVPGRAELAQYQRRFLELYNQVAAKHKETKQFYTLYNTLDDTKLYLGKELSLLNSVLDNYGEAMASASGKEQFIQQFDAIVEGIRQNKAKVQQRLGDERRRRDALSQQLLGLVELQRRYVAAVRQVTIECRSNEALLAQLRGR
ncbi:coiled-coil domain-containing protein 93 isoform X2 [Bacillus rossius redtenbacheri]|uniref:coiled-coil domain-containing protein 93 isoform X2 n=1 Tax=Bacillus rossius redtenbacheri TaxID=93214 RepID=UPI002FDC921A